MAFGRMILVGRAGLVLAILVVAGPAFGDGNTPPAPTAMDKQWPTLPRYHEIELSDQIADHLSDIGNLVGDNLDLLSHDVFKIHVNGRAQRARMRLGGGNPRYLEFRVDSDWHFAEGKARVAARVELALAGHEINVQLPAMDLSTDNYHGESMVQVNVPLLERHF
jgi:hypothetical protein